MKKTKHLLTALALLAPLALCHPAKAEGIDCRKASTYVDKFKCANADLKTQDDVMSRLYAVARVSMYGKGASGEIATQKKWLQTAAQQAHCMAMAADKRAECIIEEYKSRNLELAFSAMPKAPEAALQVLREQNIDTEPYYEALTIFTSEPDGADWLAPALSAKREKIEKLVAPAFAAVKKDKDAESDSHFNSVLFEDASVATPDDILKSSRNFAGFFRAVTYDAQTPLPCGYVVSHQGLLDATNAYFGATPDSSIIKTDCDVTAPATPKFDAMLEKINDNWPECEGTIRFAAYREFAVVIDRMLSPSTRTIEDFKPGGAPRPNEQHSIVGVSKATIKAAEDEMIAYYVKYLGVTSAKASTFAKGKIADVLYDGQQCE
jgi:uncharacterized protein